MPDCQTPGLRIPRIRFAAPAHRCFVQGNVPYVNA